LAQREILTGLRVIAVSASRLDGVADDRLRLKDSSSMNGLKISVSVSSLCDGGDVPAILQAVGISSSGSSRAAF
jgi:hypothetical protein